MPEVLVTDAIERPRLTEDTTPALAQRLASSRNVYDRVRSISSVGTLSDDQVGRGRRSLAAQ
jgi:hypothetical protein